MYAKPMILPLDGNGRIYALQDIITKPASPSISGNINVPVPQRPNLRAAITI
jgi:hypothetical protein